MGRSPKNLFDFRKKPLPQEVPHSQHMFTPPNIGGRSMPLRPMGRYPMAQNSAATSFGGRSVNRLGKDPRLNTKALRDASTQKLFQILANRKNRNSRTNANGRPLPQRPNL